MDVAFKASIVALTLTAGGFMALKPAYVYRMTRRGRGEGRAGDGTDSGRYLHRADLGFVRWCGVFLIFVAGYVTYLWAGAR